MGHHGGFEEQQNGVVPLTPSDEAAILRRTEKRLRTLELVLSAALLVGNIKLLIQMMRDRSFELTWASRSVILAALVYFLIPSDAIPDIVPGVGFIDDSIVLGAVMKRLSKEISRYKEHISWN